MAHSSTKTIGPLTNKCINCSADYHKTRGTWDGNYCEDCHSYRIDNGVFPEAE
ncbi:hypothetical protein M1M34_gp096 [Haloarcula tailed virus 2]|uniref:Uncharacterized protein n=1 Tax=Haloarcula tailed virus 2 TaxID=2877989 RepID=A0AAE8XYU4_9CAUD|nr:hypothetical protein M1M34_gp096 [Haloarcula tailed virus 2]UBF23237.1 hypothetical protein HATV-2_gp86 [Haloarcula tailed virus 2]